MSPESAPCLVFIRLLQSQTEPVVTPAQQPLRSALVDNVHAAERIVLIDLEEGRSESVEAIVERIVASVRQSSAARQPLTPQRIAHDVPERCSELTPREQEVLTLTAQGHSYESIGAELRISVNTVRYHMKRLHIKLNVHTRVAAINRARSLGLV